MANKKFEKIVEYYIHADEHGSRYKSALGYYVGETLALFITWIFLPLFFIFKKDCTNRGKRKVYWREA